MISLLGILALSISISVVNTKYTRNITSWTFSVDGNSTRYTATIPSSLSLDLVENKVITDPYYRDNFLKYYDYETKGATYYSETFTLDSSLLISQRQIIIF